MSSRRGRPKGGGFENAICADIVDAFEQFGVTDQDVYRSKQSGGHKSAYGDIGLSSALAKLFPFAPECKWWKNVFLHDLLLPWEKMSKTKARFGGWWLQTLRGAAKCHRMPLLIFKANKATVLCAIPLSDLRAAQQKALREGRPYLFTLAPRRLKQQDLSRILVVPWKRFLRSCVRVQKEKHEAIHGGKRNRVRLRPSDSRSQKQVSATARSQGKIGSARKRATADMRKQ
jgi:hypothetical protein